MTPEKILNNLENGCFMTHQEQAEAAQLIRQLQAKLAKPEQEPCKCIDQFWCATFDRCKRNETN